MFLSRHSAFALLAAQLLGSAYALRLPFKVRAGKRSGLVRRTSFSVGNTSIEDFQNAEYISEITVGGAQFQVTLDTGSSDLNIFGNVPSASDSKIPINVTFAEGSDAGLLSFADVDFAGYTVSQQIFNHAPPTTDSTTPDQGLLGLGPTSGSLLSQTAQASLPNLAKSASDSLLDRIFQQNTSTPNFMTFQLGRVDDTTSQSTTGGQGEFTIGETIPGFDNVSSMPQLTVLPFHDTELQHWTVTLDGATGANGQAVTFPSSVVSGTASGKLVTVFDSGFTIPQVPKAISDAFYGGIFGAKLQNLDGVGEIYVLPCDAAINASFTFSGKVYPIHPLDLNMVIGTDDNGQNVCGGAFQPIQDDAAQALDGAADMILGMAFLRNVYILMNFGDFVDESADAQKPPFVQLLSTTDPAAATAEFSSTRGSGGSTNNPPSTSTNNTKNTIIRVAIIAGAAVVLLGLALCIFCCVRRRRAMRYQTLVAPAPGPYAQRQWAPAPPYAAAPPYDDPFRDTSAPGGSAYDIPMTNRGPPPPNPYGQYGQ